jgi:predicted TIM-barrel fold metal-dependent hydrolase
LDLLSKTDSSTAILSLTAPGVQIAPLEEQPKLARSVNEAAAKLRNESSKFGFFAALPSLLDTKAAIEEITYALDVLKADGITLFTRYGDGNYYLGHKLFRPIWEELNRRKAVVFIHPTHPLNTDVWNPLLPQPIIDYPHETARTAFDMISTNTKRDFPDCKIILSHAGGTLPILLSRASIGIAMISRGSKSNESVIEDAKSFYYDLALSSSSHVLDTLLNHIPHDHILYGSDFPYAPSVTGEMFAKLLDEYKLSDETRAQIYYKNAQRLFPRLAGNEKAGDVSENIV